MTQFQHRTMSETLRRVRHAARSKYAWPGGYPLAVVMNDGESICTDCAKRNYKLISISTRGAYGDNWDAAGVEINYEDQHLTCAHCDKPIECAYPQELEMTS
jgi:hypothetical protein